VVKWRLAAAAGFGKGVEGLDDGGAAAAKVVHDGHGDGSPVVLGGEGEPSPPRPDQSPVVVNLPGRRGLVLLVTLDTDAVLGRGLAPEGGEQAAE